MRLHGQPCRRQRRKVRRVGADAEALGDGKACSGQRR
jgi:hypothetical protein